MPKTNGYTDLSAGRNGYEGDPSGTHPVTEITWWDAIKWCNAKSQIEGKTPAYYITPDFKPADILMTGTPVAYVRWDASGYRLPTEAEWEYACRDGRGAGNPAFHSGQIIHPGVTPLDENLNKVAWYGGNSAGNTHPVKKKKPNKFGLHDMHGNVAEWCWDWDGLLIARRCRRPPRSGEWNLPDFPRRQLGGPCGVLPCRLPRQLQPHRPRELSDRLPPSLRIGSPRIAKASLPPARAPGH